MQSGFEKKYPKALKVAAADLLRFGIESYTTNFSCILSVRARRFKRRGKRLYFSMEALVKKKKKLHTSLFSHSNEDQVEGV